MLMLCAPPLMKGHSGQGSSPITRLNKSYIFIQEKRIWGTTGWSVSLHHLGPWQTKSIPLEINSMHVKDKGSLNCQCGFTKGKPCLTSSDNFPFCTFPSLSGNCSGHHEGGKNVQFKTGTGSSEKSWSFCPLSTLKTQLQTTPSSLI